jgi:hypothetical protein
VAKVIYSAIMAPDGYIADKKGNFDWAHRDEEMHSFINELERPVGSHSQRNELVDSRRNVS